MRSSSYLVAIDLGGGQGSTSRQHSPTHVRDDRLASWFAGNRDGRSELWRCRCWGSWTRGTLTRARRREEHGMPLPLVGINGWPRAVLGRVKRWGVLASGALVLLVGARELWSQEAVRGVPARTGMVLDEDGVSRPPTPEDALRALRGDELLGSQMHEQPAIAVLRQVFEPRSQEELHQFARAMADVFLTTDPAADYEVVLLRWTVRGQS